MKILHTSDLHLKSFNDIRWKTLETILEIGKVENIDVLVISGDLFDKDEKAQELRPEIRKIFSNNQFKILLIPGNHDSQSYKGTFLGEDVYLFSNINVPFEMENILFWGFPFEDCQ